MATPWLVLSPCGTSLLTNGVDAAERSLVFQNANKKTLDDLAPDTRRHLEDLIAKCRDRLFAADEKEAAELSAELNGLLHLYKTGLRPRSQGTPDLHYLLATDTYLGKTTASILHDWLKARGFQVHIMDDISGLNTADLLDFEGAISELSKELADMFEAKSTYYKIFNLTGGFKAIQGVLQVLGQLYADEVVYIFEKSDELLRIPKLPLRFDEEVMEHHFQTLRKLDLYGELPLSAKGDLPDVLVLKLDDKISLSAWGQALWDKAKRELYRKRLWEPPSDRIVFSKGFLSDVEEYTNQPDRLYELNKRFDEFARYLEKGAPVPDSLRLKPLQGKPVPGSTHECYAWSDKDAKRLFCHQAGDKWIIDKLAPHL